MSSAGDWEVLLRRACDAAGAAVRHMPPAERRRPVGAGAGGDTTMRVDRAAEDAVIAVLAASGRPFRLVSEEAGERTYGEGAGPWIVLDPIDGSLNAARGLPVFATSIAMAPGPRMDDVVLGVVRDHGTGEEWIAHRDRGAMVDGVPVRAGGGAGLELLLVEGAYPERLAAAAGAVGGLVGRVRALGSLALSLCHAAAGRGDAMVGLGPGRSIDIAAAQLVAREAGLRVGLPREEDLPGMPLGLRERFHVVAAGDAATMDLMAGLLPGGLSLNLAKIVDAGDDSAA